MYSRSFSILVNENKPISSVIIVYFLVFGNIWVTLISVMFIINNNNVKLNIMIYKIDKFLKMDFTYSYICIFAS